MDDDELIAETDRCRLIKRPDGRLMAQCGQDAPIDLGVVKNDEGECPECAQAVAVGYALSYVKETDEAAAERIQRQMNEQEITPDEALDQCREALQAANKPELVETIDGLKEMMHKPLAELEGGDGGE